MEKRLRNSNVVNVKPYRFSGKAVSKFEAHFSDAEPPTWRLSSGKARIFATFHPHKSSFKFVVRNHIMYEVNIVRSSFPRGSTAANDAP